MKKTPIRSVSYQGIADHYALILCDGTACRRKLSPWFHVRGYADRMGYLHWSRKIGSRSGLLRFLVLVATVRQGHWARQTPRWLRIYETTHWAVEEAEAQWRVRFTVDMTSQARQQVVRDAYRSGVKLRTHHPRIYQWAYQVFAQKKRKEKLHAKR